MLNLSDALSTALCSEVVRRKAPRRILWWSNLYKLKPQICIVMHVCGHYILVYNYKETNRVYSVTDSVVKIAAHKMYLGAFPCDNLTARRCICSFFGIFWCFFVGRGNAERHCWVHLGEKPLHRDMHSGCQTKNH